MKRQIKSTKQTPKSLPSKEELNKAWEVIGAWWLHFYQLLYFQNPILTGPGGGHPFNLVRSTKHAHCLKVECQPWIGGRREEFDFLITPGMTDEQVLSNCKLILKAIDSNKQKVSRSACCPLAKHTNCVCAESFSCPVHGEMHIGTHD